MSVHLVRAHPLPRPPAAGEVQVTAWTSRGVIGMALTTGPILRGPVLDEHLMVRADATGAPWLPIADVIVLPDGTPPTRPPGCPGALVLAAAVGGRCAVGTQDGGTRYLAAPGIGAGRALPWVASFVHAWLVSGRRMDALESACLEIRWPALASRGMPAQL